MRARCKLAGDAGSTSKYVAPGKYDEVLTILCPAGFNGQNVGFMVCLSGRFIKNCPHLQRFPQKMDMDTVEETKPMLIPSMAFVPWDDQHHLETCQQTNGENRWPVGSLQMLNNTPTGFARVDLSTFKTVRNK